MSIFSKIVKTLPGQMSLDFCCDIQMDKFNSLLQLLLLYILCIAVILFSLFCICLNLELYVL